MVGPENVIVCVGWLEVWRHPDQPLVRSHSRPLRGLQQLQQDFQVSCDGREEGGPTLLLLLLPYQGQTGRVVSEGQGGLLAEP